MHLEQEVPGMLAIGFYGVMATAIGLLILLMFLYKSVNLLPFILFLIFFLPAGYYLLEAINVVRSDVPPAMQSEEASLNIGLAGVFWAIAMSVFLFGAYRSVKPAGKKQIDRIGS
ncbi:hypothetical protein DRW41_04730 [Neobacillus piezotolerans]|uniref:Uncharacterized protein n=2 Tax=Neobacillus piezotolerans TaxID=2259171 RepID=A0A3D8GXS9_9BACI|nr:hypothetical protein DRW41_04730 [Neobacillus piezotolerans]